MLLYVRVYDGGTSSPPQELVCGGTLVSTSEVVSAASCFTDPTGNFFKNFTVQVTAGGTLLIGTESTVQTKYVRFVKFTTITRISIQFPRIK